MNRLAAVTLTACLGVIGLAPTCSPTSPSEIDRDRAIALARPQVKFEVESIDAERATENGRPVWRVTFHGKQYDAGLPGLRPITIVVLDRRTGEIVSVAMSASRVDRTPSA